MKQVHIYRRLRLAHLLTVIVMVCGLVFGITQRAYGDSSTAMQMDETATVTTPTTIVTDPIETVTAVPAATITTEPPASPTAPAQPTAIATAVPTETPEPCALCAACLLVDTDTLSDQSAARDADFTLAGSIYACAVLQSPCATRPG